MPVEVVRTLRASGGDYTSIQAWDNAEARDLVSADEIAVLECYNDWPGGLNGRFSSSDSSWVCDTDRYPWIRSAPGSGTNGPNHHGGIPGAGFVAYSTSNTFDAFQFGTKFRITGLEFRFAGSNTSRRAIYDKTNSTGWILEEVITVGPAEFHASSQGAGVGYVRNVLHIKTASGGNLLVGRGASNPVYNSTFVAIEGATNGIYLNFSNHSISVTNSVFVGATNDVRPDISASIFTVQNCATTNSEGMSNFPGTGHVYGINPGTAFVDALGWDFRLSENSPLRGAGADLSHLFDIDIAGNTRGDSWDIGAFQRVDGGGGTPYQADLQPASFGVAAAPIWVETVTPYAAELQPAAFGMSARQVVYREVLNYAADLAAATFSASARAVSWAMGHVAMLAAAAFGAGAKAVSWAGAVIAELQPASMKAKARDAQYSTALSYVAELTAALFKSSAADVAVILAYVAQIKSAIFSLRARAASITGGGVLDVVRRLIWKTWRRRGRRL